MLDKKMQALAAATGVTVAAAFIYYQKAREPEAAADGTASRALGVATTPPQAQTEEVGARETLVAEVLRYRAREKEQEEVKIRQRQRPRGLKREGLLHGVAHRIGQVLGVTYDGAGRADYYWERFGEYEWFVASFYDYVEAELTRSSSWSTCSEVEANDVLGRVKNLLHQPGFSDLRSRANKHATFGILFNRDCDATTERYTDDWLADYLLDLVAELVAHERWDAEFDGEQSEDVPADDVPDLAEPKEPHEGLPGTTLEEGATPSTAPLPSDTPSGVASMSDAGDVSALEHAPVPALLSPEGGRSPVEAGRSMCAVATAGAASPPITPTPRPRDRGDITTASVVPSSPPGPSRPCLATVLREPAATTTQSLDSAASAADTAEAADPSAPRVPGPPRRRQPDALFKAAGSLPRNTRQ